MPGDASSIIDGVPLVDRRASARRAELKEIDRAGCLELLASGQIGRVVYTEAAMPAAHPVNYLLDGEEVVFRAGEGAKLAAASRGVVVGFQADEIDVERRSGWSVLGVGEAYEILDPARLSELADRLPTPWAPDRTGHCISIPLQRLTPRRTGMAASACDDTTWPPSLRAEFFSTLLGPSLRRRSFTTRNADGPRRRVCSALVTSDRSRATRRER